ncbi:hypothetical protein CPG37_07325 [Malaciobacter canalis]|uniref:PhoP regulatory network protein YrbL n=1 Tax=Malaciobacter canalis TaxID=1912871 RepID=A0ABX4LPG2_9BACT|nr:YrbL family protein [Malaciobacter canalis]PHO09815.1 hypothetical protein CPG37_07325 [Malaciobacter canalis]QEE33434.1 YrbL family protein [Malaciobacter canalis]
MIKLEDKFLFSKGSERACYNHPLEKDKIIKILYNKKYKSNQNYLEYKYYKKLKTKNVSFSHIARCYGFIETSKGNGLVFEKITDYNGNTSRTFRDILLDETLSYTEEKKLLNELEHYLLKNNILFADSTTVNLLCKEYQINKYKLIIIDGLGAKREGLKFRLYLMFNFYNKYKIIKQWKIFLKNIDKVKKKIKLNQQL